MDWLFSRKCYKCIASWFPNSLTENNFYTFYSVVRAIQKGVGKSKNRKEETFFLFHRCSQPLEKKMWISASVILYYSHLLTPVSPCCFGPFLPYTCNSTLLQSTPNFKSIYFLLLSPSILTGEQSHLTKGIHAGGNDL